MKNRHLLIFCATLALASCGGSSSFSGGSTDTSTGLGLTSGNVLTAASVSYLAAFDSGDLANVGGSIGASATAPGSAAPTANTQLSGFLVNALQQIPFGPDEFPCVVSGSVTISGDIADPLTLTVGDTFSIEATACDDGIGEVVDGLISMTVTDFSGDFLLGTYLLGMNAFLDGLQVTTATDVISSTGDASIALDTTATPFVSASVSGSSMAASSNASTETLTNYATEQSVDAGIAPAPYTLTSRGTVNSSQLADLVSYSTPVQFQGDGVDYPYTGELLLTGGNSSARLIAVDNVNVRVELDSDGDGIVDVTVDTTWNALLG
jgi:hypothetical protein